MSRGRQPGDVVGGQRKKNDSGLPPQHPHPTMATRKSQRGNHDKAIVIRHQKKQNSTYTGCKAKSATVALRRDGALRMATRLRSGRSTMTHKKVL